jgi:hypothetical protein
MIKRILESAVSPLLHHTIKARAVEKAKEKESLNDKFGIIIKNPRSWQYLEAGVNDQDFMAEVQRSASVIKNYGGINIKILDSSNDTKIYFNSPRTVIPSLKSAIEGTLKQRV